jgi:hypothetical protein
MTQLGMREVYHLIVFTNTVALRTPFQRIVAMQIIQISCARTVEKSKSYDFGSSDWSNHLLILFQVQMNTLLCQIGVNLSQESLE